MNPESQAKRNPRNSLRDESCAIFEALQMGNPCPDGDTLDP